MIAAALLAAAVVVLPVSGADTAAVKPHISATVSAATVTAGSPITISGISEGPGKTVQVWAFAGNYVNVSTVPVNADGSFEKNYDTTGLPAATYYVFVQNPGSDSRLSVTTRGYAGMVVDANTGAPIFNFTGTGSVQDAAAATALSAALSARGSDDVYTKTQFVIAAPAADTTMIMPGSDRDAHGCIGSAGYTWCEAKQKCLREWEEPCAASAAPTPTKAPLLPAVAVAALAGAGALMLRKP